MSDTNPGEPLQASVAEQLREKAELEERAAEERRADERQHEQVDRRKAEEQEAVLRHTGGEHRLHPPRGTIVGPRTAVEAARLPSWAVPAALVAGLWFARRSKLVLIAGAAAGFAIWASRAERQLDPW